MRSLSYRSEDEFLNLINFKSHLIEELQTNIDQAIKNKEHAAIFTIRITNISLLSYLYGIESVNSIIDKLILKLKFSLNENTPIYYINKELLVVFLNCKKEDVGEKANNIYNVIQFFGSESTDEPFHLISIISSINVPNDTVNAKDALEKTYNILSNIPKNIEEFYHPFHVFHDTTTLIKKKFILANCIKQALVEKKIRFAFQPIINSKTGHVAHYESLLRIVNNDGKIISAGPFIQIAEEMGFVNLIDDLALEMVVEELKNNPEINLALNLSALGIANESWLNKFKKLLGDSNLASRLIVEITETAAQRDLGKSAYFIASIQDLGCQVALDDFGAGYTSFRQLKALPIDIIKIDGSFIRDIAENSNNLLFVKTLINMSKGFGFKSIAEYVENGEIAKTLIDLDVDFMQGNYFCPAINYRNWRKGEI